MAVIISTEWLREYCPNDLTPAALAAKLSSIGLAVDEVRDIGGAEAALTLDLTANRGDCWCMIGVARELAAALGGAFVPPSTDLAPSGADTAASLAVDVRDDRGCPRYTARVVRGVKLGPSPEWMRRRLEAVGIRPISNVVDVTNYVMVEMGQPLHAFDLSLLKGNRIVVRRAASGETMRLIDGSEKKLSAEDLVIADGARPVALAGVMGGADTEIGGATRDVLLESAQFDIIAVRRTARVHGVSTESSIRFEHGVDPVGVESASRRAARLLCELAGGAVAPGVLDSNPNPRRPGEIPLRHARIRSLLGSDIPHLEAIRILASLGLALVREEGGTTFWHAPSWRQDLLVEVDLIEEIARIYGYDRLGGASTMRVFPVTPNASFETRRAARDVLTALGYTEVVGASFFAAGHASAGGEEAYRVTNPVRAGEDALRTSLVPSILAAKLANQNRGRRHVRLFEAAPVCLPGTDEAHQRLAVLDDGVDGDDYAGVRADDSAERVMLRAKGALDELAARLGAGAHVTLSPLTDRAPANIENAQGASVGGTRIGFIGLLSRPAAAAMDIKSQPAILEIDLAALAAPGQSVTRARPLATYPGIARDTALVMAGNRTWAELVSAATSAECAHAWRRTDELSLLDVYRGRQVGPGKKSVAFRVMYRADDRTLTDEDVKEPHERFVNSLCAGLAAEVRA
jgi:phenylalanyl-tRNA synthetase beta chain